MMRPGNMIKPLDYVEKAIVNLEDQLALRITVVDREGLFRFKQKSWVFNRSRSSHQVLQCCKAGFNRHCIANCRYKINALCLEKPQAHYDCCWKGLGQIAVPLRHGSMHYGVLYCGCFKDKNVPVPAGLPDEFYAAYDALPEVSAERIEELKSILYIFALGLIVYLKAENQINENYDFRAIKLKDFLAENYNRNIGLSNVAAELGLSQAYTSSFIKFLTGYNFVTLLKNIRIENAKKLLITTDCKLHDIAVQCGFANEFHFSKVFKAVTGVPPSVFRYEQ